MEMAVAAATQDYRFPPVSGKELDKMEYEISVLSPLRKVASWKEIEIGKHGVEVARGMRRGVFLPQVATETGWDLETFMNNLCEQKAGLAGGRVEGSEDGDLRVHRAGVSRVEVPPG